ATTRSDNPVTHLGVHPSELITFFALHEQAVVWVDMNVEPRAAQMMFDDVDQRRQKKLQCRAVGGSLEIPVQRVEEPKRRVGGVVFAFLGAVGEHIWNQTVTDIMRECAQNVAGLEQSSRDQGQAFQTDHRVASPIGEPMISGDDGPDFVAGGMRAGGLFAPSCGCDNTLFVRKIQLYWRALSW